MTRCAVFVCLAFLVSGALHAQSTGHIVKVNTKLLNVRSGPGTANEVVGQLPFGTMMVVERADGGWVGLIDPLDRGLPEGWVNGSLLLDLGPVTKPQANTSPARPRSVPFPSYRDPLVIQHANLECDERFYGEGGFGSCELTLTIEISIPSIYDEYVKDYVDIQCDGEISYETADRLRHTERETVNESVDPRWSTDIEIEFDFGYTYRPVVSVELEDVDCSPW